MTGKDIDLMLKEPLSSHHTIAVYSLPLCLGLQRPCCELMRSVPIPLCLVVSVLTCVGKESNIYLTVALFTLRDLALWAVHKGD